MDAAPGQLCARARFWASLRVDGELSELESALLDAHLGRCGSCSEYAEGLAATTALLRAAPAAPHAAVGLDRPHRPLRALATAATAALAVVAAAVGGLVAGSATRTAGDPVAGRAVAVVATAETPDQLRRLRRTMLLNARPLPREFTGEPY